MPDALLLLEIAHLAQAKPKKPAQNEGRRETQRAQ